MFKFLTSTVSDPFVAFKYRDFQLFLGTQLFYTVGVLVQETIIGYYLYQVTGDPLVLGLVGLFEAIPYLLMALFGGYIADRFEKKKIAQWSIAFMALISICIIYIIETVGVNANGRWLIYAAIFSIGVARGFLGPAWSSIKAFLVEAKHYSNAASWSSQFWQLGTILGPIIGGLLFAFIGLKHTLMVVVLLFILSFMTASSIKKKSVVINNDRSKKLFESLKEGFEFVTKTKILIYAITLDMVSVMFGGVVALIPVFATDILHVGPEMFGILRAAPGIGAVLMLFATAFYPPTKKAWKNMLLAIAGFGIATLVFACSTNYYLSFIALILTGAFDAISVVVRQTILQLLPPDEMRGRVNSISGIFVSCSNELGAFESGLAARLMGTVPSVVFGASVTLLFITMVYYKTKDLLPINLLDFQKEKNNK